MSFDNIKLSMQLVILTLGVLVNPSICKDNPRIIFGVVCNYKLFQVLIVYQMDVLQWFVGFDSVDYMALGEKSKTRIRVLIETLRQRQKDDKCGTELLLFLFFFFFKENTMNTNTDQHWKRNKRIQGDPLVPVITDDGLGKRKERQMIACQELYLRGSSSLSLLYMLHLHTVNSVSKFQ